jgi:hypothetical protein
MWKNHIRDKIRLVNFHFCCIRWSLSKLECSLSLMKGVEEKTVAGIVFKGWGDVWPRNTLL